MRISDWSSDVCSSDLRWLVPCCLVTARHGRRDLDAAEEQYRMAAEGGDFRGQFNYARLRAEKGDVETALAWLARVRETGTRSEERRVGKEWVRSCRSRWSPDH